MVCNEGERIAEMTDAEHYKELWMIVQSRAEHLETQRDQYKAALQKIADEHSWPLSAYARSQLIRGGDGK